MMVGFLRNVHPKLPGRNSLFNQSLRRNGITINPQLRKLAFECREIEAYVYQSAHEHITRSPRKAVEIDRLHEAAVCLLMRCAWQAAPKPLSIFTTLKPDAHEVSMANSVVSPPRFAP